MATAIELLTSFGGLKARVTNALRTRVPHDKNIKTMKKLSLLLSLTL